MGYAVGVVFQGCSEMDVSGGGGGGGSRCLRCSGGEVPFVGLTDLGLGCGGGNPESCIWDLLELAECPVGRGGLTVVD